MVRSFMTAAALALSVSGAAAQDRVRLEVYSTLEVENINDFKKSFEAENPDIEIVWNRDSTGVVTARILAENGGIRAVEGGDQFEAFGLALGNGDDALVAGLASWFERRRDRAIL